MINWAERDDRFSEKNCSVNRRRSSVTRHETTPWQNCAARQKALGDTQALATDRADKINILQKALDGAQALATERANKIDTLQLALDDTQALAAERGKKIADLQACLNTAQKLTTQQAIRG